MTDRIRDDLTLPLIIEAEDGRRRTPIVAFVPIAVAVIGVLMILFGGLSARDSTSLGAAERIDTVTTGSLPAAPARDRRHDLEMLDR